LIRAMVEEVDKFGSALKQMKAGKVEKAFVKMK
jgi:hypothetical protein